MIPPGPSRDKSPSGVASRSWLGSVFSALVGFLGMRLATMGNLRVAAAATREGFGSAFRLAYRTGTVTGMLTAGLGLLGGTLIVMYFGEKAPEVLLGYGCGGSAVGAVYAGRWRHLYEGGGCRGGSRRQSRSEHRRG